MKWDDQMNLVKMETQSSTEKSVSFGARACEEEIDSRNPFPQVSILMTCYNHEAFVVDALSSIAHQSHTNWELIVVNDGSQDETLGRIESWLKSNLAINHKVKVLSQENMGQAAALNNAFAKCKGAVLAFMDGDDTWEPTKLSEMLDLIETFPDGGIYQHQMDNGFGLNMRRILVSGAICEEWREAKRINLLTRPELIQINMPTSGLMCVRNVADLIFPIPVSLKVYPDFYIFVLGCTKGPLYSYPKRLGTWRYHGTNAGLRDQYSFKKYWIQALLPTVNKSLKMQNEEFTISWSRSGIAWEPFRHLKHVVRRRLLRKKCMRD